MSNNSLSGFSALGPIQKGLEKQDDVQNPSQPANESRKKTVTGRISDN